MSSVSLVSPPVRRWRARSLVVMAVAALVASLVAVVGAPAASAADDCKPYADVNSSNLHCKNIEWLKDKAITKAKNNKFQPANEVSRGSMTAFLFRATHPNKPAPKCQDKVFPDVDSSNEFCGFITWAAKNNIAKGYGDGLFRSSNGVTRAAMAAFLKRISTTDPTPVCTVKPYKDVAVGDPMCGVIEWMKTNKVTFGVGGGDKYDPSGVVSRQQMASFLARLSSLGFLKPVDKTPQHSTAIYGTVTDIADGRGVANVTVYAFGLDDGRAATDVVKTAKTAADGSYEIKDLRLGEHAVCFDAQKTKVRGGTGAYLGNCYKSLHNWAFKTGTYSGGGTWTTAPDYSSTFVKIASKTSRVNVSNKVEAPGSISGKVTAATGGAALENVTAYLYDITGGYAATQTSTAADGTYRYDGVRAGTYKVCFFSHYVTPAPQTGYANQCYKNTDSTGDVWNFDWSQGTSFTNAIGQNRTGINAALKAAAGIKVTVTDDGGTPAPVPNAEVTLFVVDGSGHEEVAGQVAESDGVVVIGGLVAGKDYVVCVYPDWEGTYAGVCHEAKAWDGDPRTVPTGAKPVAAATTPPEIAITVPLI